MSLGLCPLLCSEPATPHPPPWGLCAIKSPNGQNDRENIKRKLKKAHVINWGGGVGNASEPSGSVL